jgi:chitinase
VTAPPRRSRRRAWLLAVAALVGTAGVVVAFAARGTSATATADVAATWFAPWVDVTTTPTAQFQDPWSDPARQVVLGFVTAAPAAGDKSAACSPSWGGMLGLDAAERVLGLDRRVLQFEEGGGQVLVSFASAGSLGNPGGADLATACRSVPALAAVYLAVVRRYRAAGVDMDMSPASLGAGAPSSRRAGALALAQREVRAAGGQFDVWLTLPATPAGLDAAELATVRSLELAGVTVAGIDIVAADFGDGSDPPSSMPAAIEAAGVAADGQLAGVLTVGHGGLATPAQVWARLGMTVMVGHNDLPGETVTVADARRLEAFALAHGLARLSIWALNRDRPCGHGAAGRGCSGVAVDALAYSDAFAVLPGSLAAESPEPAFPALVPDDAARDPYPRWRAGERYQAGYLVVWQSLVYQAKWYSEGIQPGVPASLPSDTPWLLIGPVLPSDRAPALPTLRPGTYPAWSAAVAYHAGSRVLYQGLPYRAKYDTKGARPSANPVDPAASPWAALFTLPGEP